jgi:hypothetical protein
VAGHEQDQAGQVVPVAAAAAQLGVTPETLRKRLWRGQVPGVKLDGQWFVTVSGTEQDEAGPAPAAVPDTAGPPAGPSRPEQDSEQDNFPSLESPGAPLVDQLQGEVAFLRGQVEALQERLREAHVLLAQERALPAPSVDQEPTAHAESLPRPWWSHLAWWRR